MTTLSEDQLRQAINAVIEKAAVDSSVASQLLTDPVATLRAYDVPLPPPPDDEKGQPLADQYNQSFSDALTLPGGTTKRDFSWTSGPNSPACWACYLLVTAQIWGAIAAVGVVAVVTTDGAALAPLLALAVNISEGTLLGFISVAAAGPGTAAGITATGLFVSSLANAICGWIPNCCSDATAPDNGIWNVDSSFGDATNLAPTAALTVTGTHATPSTVMFTYQDNDPTKLYLWYRLWTDPPNTGSGWVDSQTVPNAATNQPCKTLLAPGACGIGGRLVIAFVDADPNSSTYNQLVYVVSSDGVHWSTPAPIGPISAIPSSPSLVAVGSTVYCASRSQDGSLFCFKGTFAGVPSPGTISWQAPVQITFPQPSPTGQQAPISTVDPGLGVFNETIYCGYKTSLGDGIRYVTSTDGSTWSSETWLPANLTAGRPAFAQVGNTLMVLYYSPADNHLCSSTTTDGANWTPEARQEGNSTDQPPALVGGAIQWYAFYKENGDIHVNWNQTKT